MALWLLAALAGIAAAALQYGVRRAAAARRAAGAAPGARRRDRGRACSLGAPGGRAKPLGTGGRPRCVARAGRAAARLRCVAHGARLGGARWAAAVGCGSATRVRSDAATRTARPIAPRASRAVADRAAGPGRPVVVITDGELDDADALAALPRGSRAIVHAVPRRGPTWRSRRSRRRGALLAGDTVTARVTLGAGGAGAPAGQLELRLDDQLLAIAGRARARAHSPSMRSALRGIAGGDERGARAPRAVPRRWRRRAAERHARRSAWTSSRAPAGGVRLDRARLRRARGGRGASRRYVAPDARVLPRRARAHGARTARSRASTRATCAPRCAMRRVVVLHGDTALFGAPRGATRGALPAASRRPATDEGEWFAAAAPASPLAPRCRRSPFDSLPPSERGAGACRAANGRGCSHGDAGRSRRAPRRCSSAGRRRAGWRCSARPASGAGDSAAGSAPMPTARSSARCSTGWPAGRSDRRAVVPERRRLPRRRAAALAARRARRTAWSIVTLSRRGRAGTRGFDARCGSPTRATVVESPRDRARRVRRAHGGRHDPCSWSMRRASCCRGGPRCGLARRWATQSRGRTARCASWVGCTPSRCCVCARSGCCAERVGLR